MHQYDFLNLNPLEFESLCNDLMSQEFGIQVERFKPGKDLGIDGRFFEDLNHSCIIQSKHYAVSGFKLLLNDLQANELPKIGRLNPKKYIVLTSVPLSPQDKQKICNCLTPYLLSPSDVFGKDDLNALISKYPQVERNHFKLWVMSSSVLHRFIYSATYNLSSQIIKEAFAANKNYMITSSHVKAKEKILQTNVLIITGEPGIGKTTLAEQLCLESVADGYELVVISTNIEEGYSVYEEAAKQIFYFDDFLGKNFLETLRFNEDSRIMRFVSMVNKSKNKRFILTSRTSILDQGYALGQVFQQKKLKKNEYLLDIGVYSLSDKANILYSFMWRSDLEKEYLLEIVDKKKYNEIIMHRNYNPRTLEVITSSDFVEYLERGDYLSYIDRSLENPKQVWEHPYTVQLDNFSRAIVDIVVMSGGKVEETTLEKVYYKLLRSRGYINSSTISREFESIVRMLSRSFVKRSLIHTKVSVGASSQSKSKGMVYFSPFNPSIADFVLEKYVRQPGLFSEMVLLFEGCDGILVLERLLSSNPELVNKVALMVVETLGRQYFEKDILFVARLGNLLGETVFEETFADFKLNNFVAEIANACYVDEKILDFANKFIKLKDYELKEVAELFKYLLEFITCYDELEIVTTIFSFWGVAQGDEFGLSEIFYKKLVRIWDEDMSADFIHDKIGDVSEVVEVGGDAEWGPEYEVVVDHGKLASLMCESTGELFIPMDIDDSLAIISAYDLKDMARDYYAEAERGSLSGYGNMNQSESIDEIFIGFLQLKFAG
ncbi:MAG: restriction endonuclease [Desulfovibrio sp.]